MVVFAFTGIELVGLTAGETEDPEKVIPMAINNIPLRIILFYVGSLAIIMSIYPWTAVNPAASPFVAVFTAVGITACRYRKLRGSYFCSIRYKLRHLQYRSYDLCLGKTRPRPEFDAPLDSQQCAIPSNDFLGSRIIDYGCTQLRNA